MDPLATLKEEHAAILHELYAMDRQLGSLESSGSDESRKIIESLSRKSGHLSSDLALHFQREEKAFYAVLEKRLGFDTEPVRVMRQEHEQLLGRLGAVRAEIMRMLKHGDSLRTWDLASQLQDLRGVLSDHVSREERVLFWLAELRLSHLDRRQVSFNLTRMSRVSRLALAGTQGTTVPS